MKHGVSSLATVLFTAVLGAACQPADTAPEEQAVVAADTAALAPAAGAAGAAPAAGEQVQVALMDTTGTQIGTARLTPEGQGVRVALDVSGLPAGEHGFHFHETGRCDAPGFESAGGHFAPMGNAHGFEAPGGPHAGDMENIQVGADGTLRTEVVNPRVTLGAGEASLLDGDGTALVIHAGADDYRSQPSGDSGDRIACGVIARG